MYCRSHNVRRVLSSISFYLKLKTLNLLHQNPKLSFIFKKIIKLDFNGKVTLTKGNYVQIFEWVLKFPYNNFNFRKKLNYLVPRLKSYLLFELSWLDFQCKYKDSCCVYNPLIDLDVTPIFIYEHPQILF